jgi:Uma2 family endonuclease
MRKTMTAKPEPVWELADLFPAQGAWCEEDYFELHTNRLIEFDDGYVEVLPMPTDAHQALVAHLFGLLLAFVKVGGLGTARFAPLRVRLWPKKFREPDVLFLLKEHASRNRNEYWVGADLVMEVVSEDEEDRRLDLVEKRREYARAGIGEYWIVDPRERRVTVLRLAGKRYLVHGEFGADAIATSHLLPGFEVNVGEMLADYTPTTRRRR